jgi:hypothetical protein
MQEVEVSRRVQQRALRDDRTISFLDAGACHLGAYHHIKVTLDQKKIT